MIKEKPYIWTDEEKINCSERNKGKNNPMYGKKGEQHPAFKKDKIIIKKPTLEETRKKRSDSSKKRWASYTKEERELRCKNFIRGPRGKKYKLNYKTCSVCGRIASSSMITRYHNDKCNKYKHRGLI